jgi:hypothetical protein
VSASNTSTGRTGISLADVERVCFAPRSALDSDAEPGALRLHTLSAVLNDARRVAKYAAEAYGDCSVDWEQSESLLVRCFQLWYNAFRN